MEENMENQGQMEDGAPQEVNNQTPQEGAPDNQEGNEAQPMGEQEQAPEDNAGGDQQMEEQDDGEGQEEAEAQEEEEEQMKPKKMRGRKKKRVRKKTPEEEEIEKQKQAKKEKKKQQKLEHKQEVEDAQKAQEDGKTIINVEMCMNCDEHAWCTHHKEEKYLRKFAAFKLAMSEIGDGQFHVGKNLQNGKPRIGAFEIFVGDECKFSKIERRLWPHIGLVSHKIAGKEYVPKNDKNKNGIDDEREKNGEVRDINTDGINDKYQPGVIEKYKKEVKAKAKKVAEENDDF